MAYHLLSQFQLRFRQKLLGPSGDPRRWFVGLQSQPLRASWYPGCHEILLLTLKRLSKTIMPSIDANWSQHVTATWDLPPLTRSSEAVQSVEDHDLYFVSTSSIPLNSVITFRHQTSTIDFGSWRLDVVRWSSPQGSILYRCGWLKWLRTHVIVNSDLPHA